MNKYFANESRWRKIFPGKKISAIRYNMIYEGMWMLTVVSADGEFSADDGGRRSTGENSHVRGVGHPL